jgi:NADPH:quinone reductase-like Zn-dependent oxidoreductase
VNPLTAHGFYDTLQVPRGEYLLSNAASSVLGRMVIQLGKHYVSRGGGGDELAW